MSRFGDDWKGVGILSFPLPPAQPKTEKVMNGEESYYQRIY